LILFDIKDNIYSPKTIVDHCHIHTKWLRLFLFILTYFWC